MGSKQLQSILKNIPSATASGEEKVSSAKPLTESAQHHSSLLNQQNLKIEYNEDEYERLVAVVPKSLKQAIKIHLLQNKGLTEKSVILKALALYGFAIKEEWLKDKRTTR